GDPLHVRLTSQLSLGADFSGDATNLGGEGVELVHHSVDGVLERQHFTLGVDGDLFGEVSLGHRSGHFGDVANLGGEIVGQEVDVVGQVLPNARCSLDFRLPTQVSVGAFLLGDAGDFRGEGAQLVHHRVDGLADPKELSLHLRAFDFQVYFLGEVAGR